MSIIIYKDNIYKDTNICDPERVYFSDGGQGCRTIWFKTVKEARKFIKQHGRITGYDAGLCEKCQGHYSWMTKGWIKYPAYACSQWKEEIKRQRNANV